jgi:hypothetical protein
MGSKSASDADRNARPAVRHSHADLIVFLVPISLHQVSTQGGVPGSRLSKLVKTAEVALIALHLGKSSDVELQTLPVHVLVFDQIDGAEQNLSRLQAFKAGSPWGEVCSS